MKLSAQAIYSSQSCCQETTDKIWSFMEDKTAEELRSDHSLRVLENLRNNLRLQYSRMNSVWRDHSPGDGNVNTAALNRLNMVMESTRVDVDHVLQISGEKISRRISWRPDTSDPFYPSACPEPYTSLRQFHGPVLPLAHPDSPHAQRPLYTGGVAGRASHMSYTHTTSSRRPNQFTRAVTSGQDGRATVRTTPTMQPSPTHVTKLATEAGDRRQPEAEPVFIRPSRREFFRHVPQVTFERPSEEVVLKRSTHTPVYQPGVMWHTTTASDSPVNAGDRYTGKQTPANTFSRTSKNQGGAGTET